MGNRDSPSQVSCNRTWAETALQPCVDQLSISIDDCIRGPFALLPRLLDPLLRPRLELVESHVHVRSSSRGDCVRLVDQTPGVDELNGVQRPPANVALVSSCILVRAASQKEVSEKSQKYLRRRHSEGMSPQRNDPQGTWGNVSEQARAKRGIAHLLHPSQNVWSFSNRSR